MNLILKILSHTPALGLLLAPFITALGDRIHQAWDWLDAQRSLVKQAFAIVLAFVLVGLTQFIPGFTTPQACADTIANGISAACQSGLTAILTDPGFWEKVATATLGAIAVKHGQQHAAAASAPVAGSIPASKPPAA